MHSEEMSALVPLSVETCLWQIMLSVLVARRSLDVGQRIPIFVGAFSQSLPKAKDISIGQTTGLKPT